MKLKKSYKERRFIVFFIVLFIILLLYIFLPLLLNIYISIKSQDLKQCEIDSDCMEKYFKPCLVGLCLNKNASTSHIESAIGPFRKISLFDIFRAHCTPGSLNCKCIDKVCTES